MISYIEEGSSEKEEDTGLDNSSNKEFQHRELEELELDFH